MLIAFDDQPLELCAKILELETSDNCVCSGVFFLHRCSTGGFTGSSGERALYGTVGFYLLGSNVLLTGGDPTVFTDEIRKTRTLHGQLRHNCVVVVAI